MIGCIMPRRNKSTLYLQNNILTHIVIYVLPVREDKKYLFSCVSCIEHIAVNTRVNFMISVFNDIGL